MTDPLFTGDSSVHGLGKEDAAQTKFPHEAGQRVATIGSRDALRIGLALGNALWAAVNGPRGEFRTEGEIELVGSGEGTR